jgi:hypothetical protein
MLMTSYPAGTIPASLEPQWQALIKRVRTGGPQLVDGLSATDLREIVASRTLISTL